MQSTKFRKWQGAIAERAEFSGNASRRSGIPTILGQLLRVRGHSMFGVLESA